MGIINWEGCQNLLRRLSTFIRKVVKIYWEGSQTLLGRLPIFMDIINWEGCQNLLERLSTLLERLPNFIGKVAKIYWEGCQNVLGRQGYQTLWANGHTYLQYILSITNIESLILSILFAN